MTTWQYCKDSFSRDGYATLRGVLSAGDLELVEEHLSRYLADVVPGLPPSEATLEVQGEPETVKYMKGMERYDPFFEEFRRRTTFQEIAETLLGMPAQAQGLQYFRKPPLVGKATPAHQDGFYFCLVPSEALTLWFALDKVDRGNGCVRYVPGSHRTGIRPHGVTSILGFSQSIADWTEFDRSQEVAVDAEPGDVLAHHCDTIHRAEANSSPRQRRALAIVYFAEGAVIDPDARTRYLESSGGQRAALLGQPAG